jgi:hypothetical protein
MPYQEEFNMKANEQKKLLEFFIEEYVNPVYAVDTGYFFGTDMIDEAIEEYNNKSEKISLKEDK